MGVGRRHWSPWNWSGRQLCDKIYKHLPSMGAGTAISAAPQITYFLKDVDKRKILLHGRNHSERTAYCLVPTVQCEGDLWRQELRLLGNIKTKGRIRKWYPRDLWWE